MLLESPGADERKVVGLVLRLTRTVERIELPDAGRSGVLKYSYSLVMYSSR